MSVFAPALSCLGRPFRPLLDRLLSFWAWLSTRVSSEAEYVKYRSDEKTLYVVGIECEKPDYHAGVYEGALFGLIGMVGFAAWALTGAWGSLMAVIPVALAFGVLVEWINQDVRVSVTPPGERPPLEAI